MIIISLSVSTLDKNILRFILVLLQVGHQLVHDVLHGPVELDVVERMRLMDHFVALKKSIDADAITRWWFEQYIVQNTLVVWEEGSKYLVKLW